MRLLRLLLTIASSFTFLLLLIYIIPTASTGLDPDTDTKSSFGSYFSLHTPLFPPSAIISLTDDNSTFFLARPAAFGPDVQAEGLSGELWIGSGFGEDELGRGGLSAESRGELGCSDVPGWDAGLGRVVSKSGEDKIPSSEELNRKKKRGTTNESGSYKGFSGPDGMDSRLDGAIVSSTEKGSSSNNHADIESLQESAAIAGKVVLLSRGGCGFLEKVKWAQRRGGVALIVGDDVIGGPLVTMYAKGDTSNVTIPAFFTSHTTAGLLSSLVPPNGMPFFRLPTGRHGHGSARKPTDSGQSEQKTQIKSSSSSPAKSRTHISQETNAGSKAGRGWFASLMRAFGLDSEDTDDTAVQASSHNRVAQSEDKTDDFVIGVHDWRDPDVIKSRKAETATTSKALPSTKASPKNAKQTSGLSGGSVTPSSGEYSAKDDTNTKSSTDDTMASTSGKKWFDSLRWGDDHITDDDATYSQRVNNMPSTESTTQSRKSGQQVHEGLWVTIQPTTMSASPFFDTLLVLVVSPLVTLTFVYALLLLRSRIRRRRWRAPKSVVEQLPVRTYQTISSDSTTPIASTPLEASVTTPLLSQASQPRPALSRNASSTRLRSLTTSAIPEISSSSLDTRASEAEKREAGLAEWRRKYGGKQRECVVCLEEYVDGVSRVMSLPCGHEFHEECITPWLTTRRRTCPICKGDVVRTLNAQQHPERSSRNHPSTASGSSSPLLSSSPETLRSRVRHEDSDPYNTILYSDDPQTQALLTRNTSPSAALPVPVPASTEIDLERGADRSRSHGRPAGLSRQASSRSDSSGLSEDEDERSRGVGLFAGVSSWFSRNILGFYGEDAERRANRGRERHRSRED